MVDSKEELSLKLSSEIKEANEQLKRTRQIIIEKAKFERELASLRTGLISVKSLRNKGIFLNILLTIPYIFLIIMAYNLFYKNQYYLVCLVLFFLIGYTISIFGLHNNNIKKIFLSSKSINVEK
jgi:hypothetical protein